MRRAVQPALSATFAVLLSSTLNAQIDPASMSWKAQKNRQGIAYATGVSSNRPYEGFKGTTIIDAPIGKVLSVALQVERAWEWVYRLDRSRVLRDTPDQRIVWQLYDGKYVLIHVAELHPDESSGYFRGSVRDIGTEIRLTDEEQDRIPELSGTVRIPLGYSLWEVRSMGPDRTCVRAETALDPSNMGRATFWWFKNHWPRGTLAGLQQQVRKTDIALHQEYGDWVAEREDAAVFDEVACMQGKLAP